MMRNRSLRFGLLAGAIALLAACSGGGSAGGGGAYGGGGATQAPTQDGGAYGQRPGEQMGGAAGAMVTSLATADTDLGTIVVDDKGMTVYQYSPDTQGGSESACNADCLASWPPVHGDMATGNGVTGQIGTITGTDGQPQLTLNGWPLYYYVGDSAAGQTRGQGIGGIWWVLSPAGEPIR